MRRYGIVHFLSTLAALAAAGAVLVGVWGARVCKLSELDGTRVFYLDSASSQGLRTERLRLKDLARVKGESVRFGIDAGETPEEIAKRIAEQYGAEILFAEEACGVVSYYCHTDDWTESVEIGGERVNLHVAVSETQCAVGTPIVFDGF